MKIRVKYILLVVFVVLSIPIGLFALHKGGPTFWLIWGETNLEHGIALQGYDAVAYQTQARALAGDQGIVLRHENADWYFASKDNRLFLFYNSGARNDFVEQIDSGVITRADSHWPL